MARNNMDNTKIRSVIFVATIFVFAVIAPVKADCDQGDNFRMYCPLIFGAR